MNNTNSFSLKPDRQQFNSVLEKVADWLFLKKNCYNQNMMQRRNNLARWTTLVLIVSCLGGLAFLFFDQRGTVTPDTPVVSLQLSSGGMPSGIQAVAALESSTVMQVQHPSSLQQRPAIDLALPQVTEKALFALG